MGRDGEFPPRPIALTGLKHAGRTVREALLLLTAVAVLASVGLRFFAAAPLSAQRARCFSPNQAGFTHNEALSPAGDRFSLDLRLALAKAPVPTMNFDAFVFVNGRLQHVESKIAVACGRPATRSVPLRISPRDSVSVVFTRHIADKIRSASELVRKGDLSLLEPRLLSDAVTVANGERLGEWASPANITPAHPDRPTLSRISEVGTPINTFGGIIRISTERQPVDVLIYNDTARATTYHLVCLHNDRQLAFVDGQSLIALRLPAHQYAIVRAMLEVPAEGELGLVHCYSLYSYGASAKQPVEVTPIWPAFTLRGAIR